jgi:Uma2 family endonuclease
MTALPRDTSLRFTSVDDFLAHAFSDDLPHELVDGVVVAHAAPTEEPGHILANLVSALHRALDQTRSPCHVEAGSGVRPRRRTKATLRVPDAIVRCPEEGEGNEPVAVFEILSASNSDWTLTCVGSIRREPWSKGKAGSKLSDGFPTPSPTPP